MLLVVSVLPTPAVAASARDSHIASASNIKHATPTPSRPETSLDPNSATTTADGPSGTFVINNDDATVGDPWNGTLYEQMLTGTVTEGSGGPVVQAAFSNDGAHWRYEPAVDGAFSTDWTIYDTAYGSEPELGSRSLHRLAESGRTWLVTGPR